MSPGVIILIIVIAIIVILGFVVVGMYNRLVKQRNLVAESWRQIDVELKRRYDLIPNLIETVKAFASHERQVFEAVVAARSNAVNVHDAPGRTPEAQAQAEKSLTGSLGRLFAVAENYPDLKSNQNFLNLQQEMTDTEDRIAAGRRFYNGNVRAINTSVESFPSNIIANMFGFKKEEYFELDEVGARDAVRADYGSLTGSGPSDRDVYRQPAEGRAQAAPAAPAELPPPTPQVGPQFGQSQPAADPVAAPAPRVETDPVPQPSAPKQSSAPQPAPAQSSPQSAPAAAEFRSPQTDQPPAPSSAPPAASQSQGQSQATPAQQPPSAPSAPTQPGGASPAAPQSPPVDDDPYSSYPT